MLAIHYLEDLLQRILRDAITLLVCWWLMWFVLTRKRGFFARLTWAIRKRIYRQPSNRIIRFR